MTNKELCEKYDFLLPRNVWTDKLDENFDYSYTWLDDMEDGWRKAFGLQFCEDLNEALNKLPKEERDKFRFTQIKEKYAELRVYTNYTSDDIYKVIHKYEDLSRTTCGMCGNKAEVITKGYFYPLCKECFHKHYPDWDIKEETYDIDDFYRRDEHD